MGNYSDQEMVTLIKSGKREKALSELYHLYYPKVRKYVASRGGSSDDAKDIFQDVIMLLYLKITEKKLQEEGLNIGGFIVHAAQNKWVDKTRKDVRFEHPEDISQVSYQRGEANHSNLVALITEERSQIIDKILASIGEKCQEILRLTIFYNFSMKEVAENLNFANEDSAKTQHYKCKLKLAQLYKENKYIKGLLSHTAHE